jgi:uncharacterized paraquat-inducible protein A
MKKLILIIALVAMAAFQLQSQQHVDSQRVEYNILPNKCKYINPEFFVEEMNPIKSPYKHCHKCGLGVYLGDKGQEKCTSCKNPLNQTEAIASK